MEEITDKKDRDDIREAKSETYKRFAKVNVEKETKEAFLIIEKKEQGEMRTKLLHGSKRLKIHPAREAMAA